MLAVLTGSMNLYQMTERHSNTNINVCNLDHVFVEKNIALNENGKSNILCLLYHPYICLKENCWYIQNMIIYVFGSITCNLFLVKQYFPCDRLTLNVGDYFHTYYSQQNCDKCKKC